MSQLNLSCLGTFQAILDGTQLTNFHSVKVQALLAYLAIEAERPHTREALMALLWPDDAPQSAQQSLRQALYALRRVLGDTDNPAREPFLLVTRQTIQLNPRSQVTLDVTTFLQQVQQGNLAQAVALYQADLLVGMSTDSAPFEEWLRATREYLHNLALDALDQLTQQRLAASDYAEAVTYARRQLALEPWREEAHRQVMMALALNGERSTALAQYETCRRVLADELGVEPATETTTLYIQIREEQLAGKRSAAAPPIIMPPKHNLPIQSTPFIGRTRDLAQITERLHDPTCRLLTIVGPGGMGKTRLALQAAQAILEFSFASSDSGAVSANNPKSQSQHSKFADGIYFIALADVASADRLVPAIAVALDFAFYGGGTPKNQLLDYLRSKAVLLVLDNCEHLLGGLELVADFLATAPSLKLLVTSREPLNLREEWLHLLGGMSFPTNETDTAPLHSYTAVQFFVQRARQINPGFDLAVESHAVVQICRLVEGMPLGIELAATWLRFYPCAQIVIEMRRSLDFLTTTMRNVPARHRSLRAAFEHSWNLLTYEEQESFAQLAVFQGGFTQEAAQQVAGVARSNLRMLVEKSLVQLLPSGRYQLHELLRQFAEEKLQSDLPQWTGVQARHSHYFLHFLGQNNPAAVGQQQAVILAAIRAEFGNIRFGWNWASEQRASTLLAQAMDALYQFCQIDSQFQEGYALFAGAVSQLHTADESTASVLIKAIARQGSFCFQLGLSQEAQKHLQHALAGAQRLGLQQEAAFCMAGLGAILCEQGATAEAEQAYQAGLALYRALGDLPGIIDCLNGLGGVAQSLGQYREAEQYYQESLRLSRSSERADQIGRCLDTLGILTMMEGDYATSARYYEEGLTIFRIIGNQYGTARILHGLGMIAWAQGDEQLLEAKHYLVESLGICRQLGHRQQTAIVLYFAGQVANRLGLYEEGRQHGNEALTLGKTLQVPNVIAQALIILGDASGGVGDYRRAHDYFREALDIAYAIPNLASVLRVLTSWAALLMKESEIQAKAGLQEAKTIVFPKKKLQAAALLKQVLKHPSSTYITRDDASALLKKLEVVLPPEDMIATQVQGDPQDLAAIVMALLTEPQAIR